MYKQPKSDVTIINMEHMLMDVVVSPGAPTDPNTPPTPGAPARGGIIE